MTDQPQGTQDEQADDQREVHGTATVDDDRVVIVTPGGMGVADRTEDGKVVGDFEATGIRPKFLEHARAAGINLSAELFRPDLRIG